MNRPLFSALLAVVAVALLAAGATAQSTRYRLDGSENSCFGAATASVGDLNQDGFPDLVIGAPTLSVPLAASLGCVHVVSGFDGTILHRWFGDVPNSNWGRLVARAGDVDGDGVDDVAVGAGSRRVRVYSGATGVPVREWLGPSSGGYPGAIVGVGDVDADGLDDIAVSAPTLRTSASQAEGVVFVYSGRDGSVLQTISSSDPDLVFAQVMVRAGDLNGDGVKDLLVLSRAQTTGERRVSVISAVDGSTIREWEGAAFSGFGDFLAGDDDIDGDGVPDVIVGVNGSSLEERVVIYSGRSGLELFSLGPAAFFGLQGVSTLGDLDADGFAEFAIHGATGAVVFAGFDARVIPTSGIANGAHSAGDVDGDGFDEIVSPRPHETLGGPNSGSVYVLDLEFTTPVDRGSFSIYGSGCPGSVGLPRLASDPGRRPVLGSTFMIELDGLPASLFSTPFLLLGADRTAWQGLPLPFDLSLVGAPACEVLTSIDVAVQLLNVGGRASWSTMIPNRTELMGQSYFMQGMVLDPPANAFGAVLSNGGEMRIGQP